MKAVVVRGSGVEVEDLPDPVISEGEILVEMRVCGVCGTDLYKLKSRTAAEGTVLGHELAGVVRQSRVPHLSEGDHVFVPHHVPCGRCGLCLRDSPTMCPEFKVNCMKPGGFSQLVRVLGPSAQRGVRKLREDIPFATAAMVEPLGCCVRSVRRSGMESGDTVLVVGSGQVGTYHILMALRLGAGRVIACDVDERRLEGAMGAGAEICVNASNGDPAEEILEKSGGGANVAFVTSENPAAFTTAVMTVRDGGTVVIFAHGESPFAFDSNRILEGERTVTSSYSSTPDDHNIVIDMILNGKIKSGLLDTISFSLDDAVAAIEAAKTGQALRVLIEG